MRRFAVVCLSMLLLVPGAAAADTPSGWLGVRMTTRAGLQMALAAERLPALYELLPRPEQLLEDWTTEGVLVLKVVPESPAERAGLFAGDVIVEFNGLRVAQPRTLAFLMKRAIPGRDAELAVMRDGESRRLLFIVGEREVDPPAREKKQLASEPPTTRQP